jgi:4-hydroxyphenylpyruvate dioxygenase
MASTSLGLLGYESYTFIVENLERSRKFYANKFDFREIARASQSWKETHGQEAVIFGAGEVRVLVVAPLTQSSAAARYLRRHPAGVATLSFRVKNLDQARAFLAERHATFLDLDEDERDSQGGRYRSFSIATPLGEATFRFVERNDYQPLAPGFDTVEGADPKANQFGIQRVDHVTANARTMLPLINWYRDVLGMEEYWNIKFHTEDCAPGKNLGSGLRSIVMNDPESGIKFATNEPLSPRFEASQIAKFVYDNQGPGIQHLAFTVPDIIETVGELRQRNINFLSTPSSYFKYLPERLKRLGIHNVTQDLKKLEELEILLDGEDNTYMLQIFLQDAAGTYDDERAGPFFYEIIQRAGHPGFGYGNFRALFESIEREQQSQLSPPG